MSRKRQRKGIVSDDMEREKVRRLHEIIVWVCKIAFVADVL